MKKTLSAALLVLSLAGVPQLVLAATENPVPVRTVKPQYPRDMREQGISGLVMIKCTIDEQGNVTETAVTKSSNEAFDKHAIEAIKKWKFKPARQDGTPVAIQVTIPLKFVVDES